LGIFEPEVAAMAAAAVAEVDFRHWRSAFSPYPNM